MVSDVTLSQGNINATANGNNIIIAKGVSQKTLVYGFTFICSAAVSIKWVHASTDYHTAMPFLTGGAWDKDPVRDEPIFVVPENEDFILNLSGAIPVTGLIWYKRVGV